VVGFKGERHKPSYRPELRANLLRIVSIDLAANLRDVASPGQAAEELVPK
jgi:hypothetical protein